MSPRIAPRADPSRRTEYLAEDAFEEGLRTVIPQGRAGIAADVADAALYLASDQSAYVNGIALTVANETADGD